jgi:hypothetical protein
MQVAPPFLDGWFSCLSKCFENGFNSIEETVISNIFAACLQPTTNPSIPPTHQGENSIARRAAKQTPEKAAQQSPGMTPQEAQPEFFQSQPRNRFLSSGAAHSEFGLSAGGKS